MNNYDNIPLYVFFYWDGGYEKMPEMIKYIFEHNCKISILYNFTLILLTDNNITNYIKLPKLYNTLAPNFKSDIIRFSILHKYGGIWFDTDVIILKNLNNVWKDFVFSDKDIMLEEEIDHKNKVGCASILMRANTKCSKFCYDYINCLLDAYPQNQLLKWDFLGPTNVKLLCLTMPEYIIVNTYDQIINGSNFISYGNNPGINKSGWLLSNELQATQKANEIFINSNCSFVLTWTIYRINNFDKTDINNIINMVFNNNCSVFCNLIQLSLSPFFFLNINFHNNIFIDNVLLNSNMLNIFSNINIPSLDEIIIKNNIHEQKLPEQQLREIQLQEQILQEQKLQEQKLQEQKLQEQKLQEQILQEQILQEQILQEQILHEQKLQEQKLQEQILQEQILHEQKIYEQKLYEQKLQEQKLQEQKLYEQKLYAQKLPEQQLHEIQLHEQKLQEQKLHEQILQEQILQEQKLHEQILQEQILQEQILQEQILQEQKLYEKILHEQKLHEQKLHEQKLHEQKLHEQKIYEQKIYEQKLPKQQFRAIQLHEKQLRTKEINNKKMQVMINYFKHKNANKLKNISLQSYDV